MVQHFLVRIVVDELLISPPPLKGFLFCNFNCLNINLVSHQIAKYFVLFLESRAWVEAYLAVGLVGGVGEEVLHDPVFPGRVSRPLQQSYQRKRQVWVVTRNWHLCLRWPCNTTVQYAIADLGCYDLRFKKIGSFMFFSSFIVCVAQDQILKSYHLLRRQLCHLPENKCRLSPFFVS